MWPTRRRIAVFDLNEADCAATAAALRACYAESGADPPEIVPFTSVQGFTHDFGAGPGSRYDMAFWGIDGMLGVETARILRGHNPDCPLFLLSDTADYALEGYRLHALDYVLKPATAQRLREAMECIELQCLAGTKGAHYG